VTYRFHHFTLDSDTRRLLEGQREIHLSPKAFNLLLVLVQNRVRAMSRAELQKHLWPSTFVLDTNLASLVAEIRRALDDIAEDPRFVRTMHRFGYWFIGAIQGDPVGLERTAPPIKYWLVWETRQVPLSEGENIVGRSPDAAVWIDAPGVSRHHARIVLAGSDATLEDLGIRLLTLAPLAAFACSDSPGLLRHQFPSPAPRPTSTPTVLTQLIQAS
jgi:DNA-binding winged helix-turn-helix (wHTH) protein